MIESIEIDWLIISLLALVVGVLAGYLSARHKANRAEQAAAVEIAALQERLQANATRYEERLAELKAARQSLGQEFENLANRIFDAKQEKFSLQSKQTLEHSLGPVREELKSFRKKVEDVYDKENADRNRLVGQITELQKQAQQISQGAENLTNALKGESKVQGNWGEVVLERLLEESGLRQGREYQTQASFTDNDGKRKMPDVIVRLPDERDIVIDSKVSLTDYERYCSAEQDDQRQQHLKAHINSLRAHITGLSRKGYEQLEEIRTLDFVLIFVPIEAAFMVALENDHSLFRDAYDKGIILVSPSTLLATLRTIHNIWRFEDQNRNAEKIAKQAGGLYDQFVLLIEAFNDVGKHLERSQLAWDTASKRLHSGRGNLIKRVEDIKVLGAKAKKQIAKEALKKAQDEAENLQISEEK
ncbi:DNA recombination protein RmuC [Porticoccus sp. W117]|uniref:DNA recombination protein RmuC n=1 Tax=Porticoccus sp. W117 TaxID=3054777 RepID=UPI002593F80C|nr:DNA recombination protein RmuC [Porticoccus sp. W117]MDM3870162.1 DNA recombination protein RmuC [Porticoccus sp. W117]